MAIQKAMFNKTESVMRQAAFKNGQYYDVSMSSILRGEYFDHKNKGEYEVMAVLKRLTYFARERKRATK